MLAASGTFGLCAFQLPDIEIALGAIRPAQAPGFGGLSEL